MKYLFFSVAFFLFFSLNTNAQEQSESYQGENFKITDVKVSHDASLGVSIWKIKVNGKAGATTPQPAGQLNGAPVLGYVFPTSLKASDVGFSDTEGIVALGLTSHPDFDDTPLWDENSDQQFDNDGVVWHPHWVILQGDKRVAGGFSVKQFDKTDSSVVLPPTNPGMPMYMDSPGFPVTWDEQTISVVIPDYRINNQTDFKFDAVACYMQVNTEKGNLPMLGVYQVYSIASGDLSLPYQVEEKNTLR